MRIWLFAGVISALLSAPAAQAATGPKLGPNESWSRMQKFEYYIGLTSAALDLCNSYGLANELKALADLSPYGRKGWASLQSFDDLRGGQCTKVMENAREILADRDRILAYLARTYDCPGGECAPVDGDGTASAMCRPEADEHLKSLPIRGNAIKSVKMVSRNVGATRVTTGKAGHEAWVRLDSCEGWLIIEMTKACYPRQTFTRGDCEIEGVSKF